MQVPQSKFFEVTINPQQLWIIIQGIHLQIASQSKKISQIATLTGNLQTFITKKSERQTLELHNFQRSCSENYKQLKTYFKEKDQKYEKKMNDFQSSISSLNLKLQSLQNQLRDEFALRLSYFQKKIINYEMLQQDTKNQLEDIRILSDTLSAKFQHFQEKYSLQLNKNEEFRSQLQEKLVSYDEQVQKQKQTVQKIILVNKDKSILRSKQRIKTQKNINQQQKIFDIKFTQKADEINEMESLIRSQKQEASKLEQRKPKQFLRLLAQKFEMINQSVNEKLPDMQEKVQRYIIKTQIVSQQLEILNRKMEKEKSQFNVLTEQIKLYDQKRNNQKTIQNIKSTLSQLSKQISDGLEAKLNKQVFEKYQKYIKQKLSYLVQSYLEKADKSEVKKGFSFLEDKLKEMILVIAEQRNLNQDSAVKKIPPKCLSCDKQLQMLQENKKKQLRTSFNVQARVSTPNLRKKYKILNQTTADEEK